MPAVGSRLVRSRTWRTLATTSTPSTISVAAIAHNTAELRCGRMIEKFPEIVTRLAGVVERFATALDCVDTGFLSDGILDELPTGTRLGATRVGGVDLNKPACATHCAPP
jgi:hypothetical protein